MNVATSRSEVGIKELKNRLSEYVGRARSGEEVIVTDRGRPVARLTSVDGDLDHLADLVSAGLVRPPVSGDRSLPKRIQSRGSVSDLVSEQRR